MIKDLNLLNVFYQTAQEGSISKAAKALFISQPAVSQEIKALEKDLKLVLFVRHAKGVKLTSEGKEIFKICERIFSEIQSIDKLANDLNNLDSGVLRIGASDTICKYYLIDKLKEFEGLYPNIRYRVTNCTTQESLELLKKGAVDISFIHSPIMDKDYILDTCLTLNDYFVCSYEFDDSKIKSLRDVCTYRLLLLEQDSYSRKLLDESLKKYNIKLKPKFELASLDVLIAFCKKNMGIICVAKEYIEKELENKELKLIHIKEPLDNRFISLARYEKNYLSNPAQKFISLINDKNKDLA